MLSHPAFALVGEGRLIKRRTINGEVADDPADFRGLQQDAPLASRAPQLMPDATMALPIALGIVDPRSDLARRTLDDLDAFGVPAGPTAATTATTPVATRPTGTLDVCHGLYPPRAARGAACLTAAAVPWSG